MIVFAIHLDQLRPEVRTDLGEDASQLVDRDSIQYLASVFGHEDPMSVRSEYAVPPSADVLIRSHRPTTVPDMQRLQDFKYKLRPNGEQQRQTRRFAGSLLPPM